MYSPKTTRLFWIYILDQSIIEGKYLKKKNDHNIKNSLIYFINMVLGLKKSCLFPETLP